MALTDLTQLDPFIVGGLPPGYPADERTLYSPVDDVHGALKTILRSVTSSLILAIYGFDDEELADIVLELLTADHIPVTLMLDSSQAGGVHERRILAREHYPASSVVIGRSEKKKIVHLKAGVADGHLKFGGSTNWSDSGERLQDNELIVQSNPLIAARATARLTALHNSMLASAGHAPQAPPNEPHPPMSRGKW